MAYYLILAGFLAAAGIGYRIQNRWEFPGKLLMIAGGLGCVGLIIWQVRGAIAGSSTPQLDRYQLIVLPNLLRLESERRHILQKRRWFDDGFGFEREGREARLQPRKAEQIAEHGARVTNLVATGKSNKRGQFSLAAFEQACAARSNEVAYVSFAGVPAGIEELSILKQGRAPQLFVFDPLGTTDWLAGLKLGMIRRVVVPRPDAQPARNVEVDGRPDEIFQRYFLMATPETADQVAAQLNTK